MDTDDVAPPRPPKLTPLDLDEMSIEALEEHIAALEAEIESARSKIAAKKEARGAAQSVFKS